MRFTVFAYLARIAAREQILALIQGEMDAWSEDSRLGPATPRERCFLAGVQTALLALAAKLPATGEIELVPWGDNRESEIRGESWLRARENAEAQARNAHKA